MRLLPSPLRPARLHPVRRHLTNDGDTALTLDDVRIQFISADNDKIPAATLDDINRRLFSTRSAMGTKVPLVPLTIHHAPLDKKITEDDADFGFPGTTVKPHSTLAGYLFYDVRGLDDPALKGAQFYVKYESTPPGNQKQLLRLHHPLQQVARSQSTGQEARKTSRARQHKDTPAMP